MTNLHEETFTPGVPGVNPPSPAPTVGDAAPPPDDVPAGGRATSRPKRTTADTTTDTAATESED